MRSQFVNGFIANIKDDVSARELNIIINKLEIYITNFEIDKRNTEIVQYNCFPDSAKEYLVTRRIEGMAESTSKSYYGILNNFFRETMLPQNQITKEDIVKYIHSLNCSNRTKSNYLTVIKTYFTWAVNEGYLDKNPCMNIKTIKYQRKQPKHLTDMELELLRNNLKNDREKAIFEFFYSTGCRASEVMNLKKCNLDLNTGEVIVTGKGNKTRPCYLNAKAIISLRKYFETRTDDDEHVFVITRAPFNKICKTSLRNFFFDLENRSGINKHIHPHLMRHTNATIALEKGMPIEEVQRMLGHADINTTLLYAEVANSSVKRSHARCVV